MIQDIPPSVLRAFEAAGRTGSFRMAAMELELTPSAVSHAVRKLERTLGASLFEREGRAMRLSPEGEALMRHVGRTFDELRRGLEIVSTRGPMMLRLH
jgi:LysR family transcriptional regulator, glycine cleavage system transcriptional activator